MTRSSLRPVSASGADATGERERVELAADNGVLGHVQIDRSAHVPEALVSAAVGASVETLSKMVVDRFPGYRVRVHDSRLASALAAAGSVKPIHRRLMVLDLVHGLPRSHLADGYVLARISGDASRYVVLHMRAYPPEHPDYDPSMASAKDIEGTIRAYFRGEGVGLLNRTASREVRDQTNSTVGLAIVNEISLPLYEGAWLTELMVDPAHQGRGLGAALVAQVALLLSQQGRTHLGLAVTGGIPGERLYEKLGFSARHETWWIQLRQSSGRAFALLEGPTADERRVW